MITEGALKAETARLFKAEHDVLASSGVSCSHKEIVAAARFRALFIAFDADYYENIHVAGLSPDSQFSFADSIKRNLHPQMKILTWSPKHKGIDDALLQHISIVPKSPLEWFESLSAACQHEIVSMFHSLK